MMVLSYPFVEFTPSVAVQMISPYSEVTPGMVSGFVAPLF